MPNDPDTAQVAETGAEVIGNDQEQSAVVSETPSVPEQPVENQNKTDDELEKLRKERDQANMRANQLENEAKERARREAEEAGRYKELYEQKLAEDEARAAELAEQKRQQDAKSLRDEAVETYKNDRVKELAKTMLEDDDTLFFWGDGATSKEEAQAQVKAKLDKLAKTLNLTEEVQTQPEEQPIVDANNPLPESSVRAGGVDMKALEKKLANFKF